MSKKHLYCDINTSFYKGELTLYFECTDYHGGILQPYVKVGGVEQISSGGKLQASGGEWRPNLDGVRAELGCGVVYQLNPNHLLSLDYEASFGDKFDKPWGLTAGYRYRF